MSTQCFMTYKASSLILTKLVIVNENGQQRPFVFWREVDVGQYHCCTSPSEVAVIPTGPDHSGLLEFPVAIKDSMQSTWGNSNKGISTRLSQLPQPQSLLLQEER